MSQNSLSSFSELYCINTGSFLQILFKHIFVQFYTCTNTRTNTHTITHTIILSLILLSQIITVRNSHNVTIFTSLHTDKLIYKNITNNFLAKIQFAFQLLIIFDIYFYLWHSTYCFCQFYINNMKNYIKSQTSPTRRSMQVQKR